MNNSDNIYLIYEPQWSKTCGIIISLMSTLVLLPLFYSIIWYEKYASNSNQTFLNKIVASICFACIFWLLFAQLPDTIRYTFGPFSPLICYILSTLKNAIVMHVILLFCLISIMRCVFACGLRNPGSFNDSFWTLYLNLAFSLLSLIAQAVFTIRPGNTVLFAVCIGKVPLNFEIKCTKINHILLFTQICSFILHILVKMFLVCCKGNLFQKVICKPKPMWTLQKLPNKFADFFVNFINIGLLCFAIQIQSIINKISLYEIHIFPNYVLAYFVQLYYPCLLSFITICIYFMNHKHFRTSVLRELKEFCLHYNNLGYSTNG